MKNPFKRFRPDPPTEEPQTAPRETAPDSVTAEAPAQPEAEEQTPTPAEADDGFDEWCRSQVRGGIERRERNDIYEAYSVYGADAEGRLACRVYHRYPEHERDFDLSYSRILRFDEFNRRLLAELDRGDLKLADYRACIDRAERLTDPDAAAQSCDGSLSEEDSAALSGFCDAMDNLHHKSYLHSEGVLSCECESVVGGERLILRFRKPLRHDALEAQAAGVKKESIGGYDIDNLWIMGVYNRLRERCAAIKVARLSSEWSIEHESLYLLYAEGFTGIEGPLLIAVGEADSFRRFGFFSLDFSQK